MLKKFFKKLVFQSEKLISFCKPLVRVAIKLRNSCNNIIGFHLGMHPRHKIHGEAQALQRLAQSVTLAVDVGANVGYWTDLLSRYADSSTQYVLLEPSISSYQYLTAKYKENQNVRVFNLALSDSTGVQDFYDNGNCSETSSLVKLSESTADQKLVQVNCFTLDEFMAEQGIKQIDFLKIDTEGNDLKVILGAQNLLRQRAIRYMQFEYSHMWISANCTLGYAYNFSDRWVTGFIPYNKKV